MLSTHRAGESLVEVLIATALLAIFASTLFVIMGGQLLTSTGNRESVEAIGLAREGLEVTRSIRDRGWSSFATGTHGLLFSNDVWTFQGTSDTNAGYTRTITVSDLNTTDRAVTSTVAWTDSHQRPHTISLVTTLSNWRNAAQPRLSGNWRNPQTLGTIDLGPGNQGTGLAVKNGIVYISGVASSAGKPDFYVINAQNGSSPVLLKSLDTGPGLNDVAVQGSFAYTANESATAQLQILNISATSSPYVIENFGLTGNSHEALSVAVTGTLALVGTEQDAIGPEFYLVDVSNLTAPQIRSTIEIGANVNRISVYGNRVYLATASSTHEFWIVDISNPNVPVVRANPDLPGTGAALAVYVNDQDNRAYVTRQAASGNSPEVNVYNVANPDAPTLLGSMEMSADVPSVFAADSLLFLGTAISNMEFQIFDDTNPASMTFYSGLNFPQVANDIAFENNIIYVAVRSNDALRIITSQ